MILKKKKKTVIKLLAGQLFNRWIDYHYFALRVNLLINEQKK